MNDRNDTTSRRGFLASMAGGAAALAVAASDAKADGITGRDRAVEAFSALAHGGNVQELEVVVPKPILALLGQKHATPAPHQTAASIAHSVAEVMGHRELAKDIKAGITSPHFSGRLTAQQIAEQGLDKKYDHPELYVVKVRQPGGRWNAISVNLENFADVGIALEAVQKVQKEREDAGHPKLCSVASEDLVKSIGKPSTGRGRD